jgi:ABC-2 type transport system ATP-binding protein
MNVSEKVLAVEHLVKDFKSGLRGLMVRAVDDISFSIGQNEVFGLLGPNGCGKSTTMKILLGLVSPSSGVCSVFEGNAETVAHRKRIGYLPEAPYFQKFMTGREVVKMAGVLCEVPSRNLADRVGFVLEQVNMESAADRKVGTYSKGMLQRIGLAQAMVHNPDLLILDEPTAGVDPVGAEDIAQIILRLKKDGKTIFLCSHLLAQVEEICDRVAIMNKGKIVTEGAVDDLLMEEDKVHLEVSEIDAQSLDAIMKEIQSKQGSVTYLGKKRKSLRDLFINSIR